MLTLKKISQETNRNRNTFVVGLRGDGEKSEALVLMLLLCIQTTPKIYSTTQPNEPTHHHQVVEKPYTNNSGEVIHKRILVNSSI